MKLENRLITKCEDCGFEMDTLKDEMMELNYFICCMDCGTDRLDELQELAHVDYHATANQ